LKVINADGEAVDILTGLVKHLDATPLPNASEVLPSLKAVRAGWTRALTFMVAHTGLGAMVASERIIDRGNALVMCTYYVDSIEPLLDKHLHLQQTWYVATADFCG